MKTAQLLRTCLLMVALTLRLATIEAVAQAPAVQPQGYWVLETNVRQPPFTLVRMYSLQHELLYEERIEGQRLSPCRRRHVRLLNTALTNVLQQTQLARRGMQRGNLLTTLAKL